MTKYKHSNKLSLSILIKELQDDKYLQEKAVLILEAENQDNTPLAQYAVESLLDHWMYNGGLTAYSRKNEKIDIAALMLPYDPDNPKTLSDNLEFQQQEIYIYKADLKKCLEDHGLRLPSKLFGIKSSANTIPTPEKIDTSVNTQSLTSTGKATKARQDKSKRRIEIVQNIVDESYKKAARRGLNWAIQKKTDGSYKDRYPFTAEDLRNVLISRRNDLRIQKDQFKKKVMPSIEVELGQGPKKCDLAGLLDILSDPD